MNHISHIGIRGYKRLTEFELALKPLVVIIGTNGVGKTSLLEALTSLAASANGKLNERLVSFGGYESIVSMDRQNDIDLSISIHNESSYSYHISLLGTGIAYKITDEEIIRASGAESVKLLWKSGDQVYYVNELNRRGGFTLQSSIEPAISQMPVNAIEPGMIRLFIGSIAYYRSFDITSRSPIRTPQTIRPTLNPGHGGENLISCLYNIRLADRNRFELIEDWLHVAFPDFEFIDFPPVAAGTLSMLWKDKRYTQPLYPHQLSDGMLRFLWLTALLYSPELPAITLIDEPEVSLHPRMLSLLAEMLREASQRAQIIVATQSEALVRFMQPEEVLVMDLDEAGHTTATWANEMELGDWLEDYTLDKLWRIGRLEEH